MTTGSSYEKYEKTHSDYDKTRMAVGSEQIISFLRKKFPHSQPRILDAGCGTGVHLQALQEAGFTSLTGLDASRTGLAKTREKLGPDATLVCGDIRDMPFAAESFDVVLFSFVLHHLPHQNETELKQATAAALAGATRLLAPGGQLVIVTCTREQMSPRGGCMWYYRYFASAANQLAQRFLPATIMTRLARKAGFKSPRLIPLEKTYWTAASLDPHGPMDSSWRSGDSLFALCEKDAVAFQKQLRTLQGDIDNGAVNIHIAQVKARTERIRQGVLIFAHKLQKAQ